MKPWDYDGAKIGDTVYIRTDSGKDFRVVITEIESILDDSVECLEFTIKCIPDERMERP